MMQPTILDTTPRGLADALDALARRILDSDREVAEVLAEATGALQAIAWNRYARTVNRRGRRLAFKARQQAHCRRRVLLSSWVREPRS